MAAKLVFFIQAKRTVSAFFLYCRKLKNLQQSEKCQSIWKWYVQLSSIRRRLLSPALLAPDYPFIRTTLPAKLKKMNRTKRSAISTKASAVVKSINLSKWPNDLRRLIRSFVNIEFSKFLLFILQIWTWFWFNWTDFGRKLDFQSTEWFVWTLVLYIDCCARYVAIFCIIQM